MTQLGNQASTLGDNNSRDLHFSAIYHREYPDLFSQVNVYKGAITCTKCDAILNVTVLCNEHQRSEVKSYESTPFIKWRKMENIRLNCTIYDACPYCLITSDLHQLLLSMDDDKKTIVAIPLLNTEMDAGDIRSLVNRIEEFTMVKRNNLNQIDFIIHDQERATEIATWMQMGVYMSAYINRWEVVKHCSQENWGIKGVYISQDINQFKNMQARLEKSIPSCISYTIDGLDFATIDHHHWQQIALQFWCQFNTILIHQKKQEKILLHGMEENILKALSAMSNVTKNLTEEKAFREIYELTAQNSRWYVNIFNHKAPFDKKLNYCLESGYKDYKKYGQEKREINIRTDASTRLVNYEHMTITMDSYQRYPIGKQFMKGL